MLGCMNSGMDSLPEVLNSSLTVPHTLMEAQMLAVLGVVARHRRGVIMDSHEYELSRFPEKEDHCSIPPSPSKDRSLFLAQPQTRGLELATRDGIRFTEVAGHLYLEARQPNA
jgi:hypothetical protein